MYKIKFLDGTTKEFKTLGGANLAGADLERASLIGANLEGVDLGGASLERANLVGVNLRGANLVGTYLRGANLEGANLSNTKDIIIFQAGKHFGFSYWYEEPMVKIGCNTSTLTWWLENYKVVGSRESYSEIEIYMYGDWLKMLDKTYRRK